MKPIKATSQMFSRPGAGVDRRDDQHGLAGHRNAEVLEEDQSEREIAKAVERRLEAVEDAR